jgi:lysosomal acid lipase/cholesteryl ester hydrolase
MGHFPSGSSMKNMNHFQQIMSRKQFAKFDYGKKTNMKVYGTKDPPIYNLSNIDVPIRLYKGDYDKLADSEDVKRLWDELGSKNQVNTI